MLNMFRRCANYKNFAGGCRCSRQKCVRQQCKFTREILNINEINYDELLEKLKNGATLIDTRTKQEFLEGHLNGAILIPYYEMSRRIENIIPDKNRTIIVYCQNGGRSAKAYEVLKRLGYENVYNLKGGMEEI